MNGKFWKALTLVIVALVLVLGATMAFAQEKPAAAAEAKKPAYVGSKACKMCHMGEKKGKMWEIWSDSKHSKALSVLDSTQVKDPKCLKCHTTGYGMGGYDAMTAMTAPDALGAVGCEACHGPGSEYKSMSIMKDKTKAIAAGLVVPDEKVCVKCHNEESPTFKKDKPFKFDEMWKLIAHKVPVVADTTKPAPGK
jgi:hypothetical protein